MHIWKVTHQKPAMLRVLLLTVSPITAVGEHDMQVAMLPVLPQAVGELRTVDGRAAARSSRLVVPKPRSAIVALVRSCATAPLAAIGFWQDYVKMQVHRYFGTP